MHAYPNGTRQRLETGREDNDGGLGSRKQAWLNCVGGGLGFSPQSVVGPAAAAQGDQKEELENLRKQHDLLKKMLEQQEQLRALQGRQAALLAMQRTAEQAIAVMDDTGERGGG